MSKTSFLSASGVLIAGEDLTNVPVTINGADTTFGAAFAGVPPGTQTGSIGPATTSTLGVVKVGTGLAVATDGTLSATAQSGTGTSGSATVSTNAVVASTSTTSLSFGTSRETSFQVTLQSSTAITIGTAAAGQDQVMTVDLIQSGSGGFVPSFANVSWPGGVAPTFNTTSTKRDTLQFRGIGSDISGYPVSMGRLPLVSAAPAAPASITVTPGVTSNSVTVPAVAAYPAVTGYTISRSTTSGAETVVATNVAVPYSDTGLTAGTTYFYKAAAVNSVGTGAASPEGSGVPLSSGSAPGAPGALTLTPGDTTVTVSVPAVTASPAVTGYTIYRSTSAGAETVVATNVSSPYVDAGLTDGTTYYYQAAAVNSVGTGSRSPEASTTPVAAPANSAHYATFSGLSQAIYASPSNSFNPGSNQFDLRAHINMANYAPGGSYETNLWGVWDGVTPANRVWRLGITTDGKVRASWATSATVFPTATSASSIPTAGNNDVWVRAVVTPTTGAVSFYTSTDNSNWTALGASQTASSSGAVYTPTTNPYMVIGQDASGGSAATQEQFYGRMIQCQLRINGTLVTNPIMTNGSSTTDSLGFAYSTSSGVAYT